MEKYGDLTEEIEGHSGVVDLRRIHTERGTLGIETIVYGKPLIELDSN